MSDPNMSRLRELLAKAEKGSVIAEDYAELVLVTFLKPNSYHRSAVTPAQFAQMKSEFPTVWKE